MSKPFNHVTFERGEVVIHNTQYFLSIPICQALCYNAIWPSQQSHEIIIIYSKLQMRKLGSSEGDVTQLSNRLEF